jgi:hypothetical protein
VSLVVDTPAASTGLTELDGLKRAMGITDKDNDAFLRELIQRASDEARTFCSRQFSRQQYTEDVRSEGSLLLQLAERPVVSVETVTLDGVALTDHRIEDAEAGELYRELGWEWHVFQQRTLGGGQPLAGEEFPKYVVQYTAGWLLPGETGRTLPHDVERAIIDFVKAMYGGKGPQTGITTSVGAVKSKAIDGLRIEYDTASGGAAPAPAVVEVMPPSTVATLRRYRVGL